MRARQVCASTPWTPPPSASDKTLVAASIHGNMTAEVMVNGKPPVIGLHAYIKS